MRFVLLKRISYVLLFLVFTTAFLTATRWVQVVESQGFCGIPGYEATVEINAKECLLQGSEYICDNNGVYSCNGTYPCIYGFDNSLFCNWQGNVGSCNMEVTAVGGSSDDATGCDISADKLSCSETYDTQTASCWVNTTPTPTPFAEPTPTPGGGGGCTPDGSCSDNGNCSNTCTGSACGWDSCGGECRFGTKNCSGNQTPIGFHDGKEGEQLPANCTAGGWAKDPDDTNFDVPVRILVDGNPTPVTTTTAGNVRGDLTGECPGGSCAFDTSLWALITNAQSHSILAQARDKTETDTWSPLTNTPKNLNCFPNPPSGITASCSIVGSQPKVTVNWSAAAGAGSYILRLNKSPYGGWMGSGDQWNGPATSGTAWSVDGGTTYSYSVQSVVGADVNDTSKRSWLSQSCDIASDPTGCPTFNCPLPTATPVPPTPTPTTVLTPTPTPTPVCNIVTLNSQTGRSCNDICTNDIGGTCGDVGTNAAGNNGLYSRRSGFGVCSSPASNCGAAMGNGGAFTCSGNLVNWTNCSCDLIIEGCPGYLSPTPSPTSSPTPTPTATPAPVNVEGVVYDDPDSSYSIDLPTGRCMPNGHTPIDPPGDGVVTVNPDAKTGPVQGNGIWQVTQVTQGTKSLTLGGLDPAVQCNCPSGCQYPAAVVQTGQTDNWNFFVTTSASKWWKALGGPVHSESGVNITIPITRYLIDNDTGGAANYGPASKKSGSSFTVLGGSLMPSPVWDLTEGLSATTWRYGYQNMYLRLGKPTTNPGNGNAGPPTPGLYKYTGEYTIDNGAGSWKTPALTGSRIIFVEGNVTINTDIKLQSGSGNFLAIISTGDIQVDPTNVGNSSRKLNPAANDANLIGAFLADGNFKGGTDGPGDTQLVIYGTVAADADLNGVGNVITERDMDTNNDKPGVAFIWNPNLLLNAPEDFKESLTDWREVAP